MVHLLAEIIVDVESLYTVLSFVMTDWNVMKIIPPPSHRNLLRRRKSFKSVIYEVDRIALILEQLANAADPHGISLIGWVCRDRADAVIAIQSEEAKILSERTTRPMHIIGHITPANYIPPRRRDSGPIVIGYMASDNPSNRLSLQALIDAVEAHPAILELFKFVIGGLISRRLPSGTRGFTSSGYVPEARDFYGAVDMIINPNISGTGLKIKSVEGLAYGMPLASTADGMCGISSVHPLHNGASVGELVETICTLDDPNSIAEIGALSRRVFEEYRDAQFTAFKNLLDAAARHVPRRELHGKA